MSTSKPAIEDDGQTSIRAIKRGDVHRITSGQVVLDIQSAVKELVENSLDAGATVIDVRFKEYGADLIEVSDNGTGIEPSNYNSLALKHHTSKLQDFADLITVQTFGFRGEALSSLCELGKVQFITATQNEEPVGTVLEMNRDGSIANREKKVARPRGTTASVSDLFHTLPVRRKELVKNVRREFAKAQALLQAYAIISQGKRWIVSNTVKGKKNVIMTIPACNTPSYLSSNVTAVFGPKASPDLVPLNLQIPLSSAHQISSKQSRKQIMYAEEDVEDEQEGNPVLQVKGLISRPSIGCGRTSSDRCFLYINGRPWDSQKMVRAFNEVYRQFNIQQYPMVIADFKVQGDQYDVNVSPDKRTLFLHREGEILERLKVQLEDAFNPYQSMFRVNDRSGQESNSILPFKPVSNRHNSDELGEQSVWSNVDVAKFATGRRRRASSSSEKEGDVEVRTSSRQTKQLRSDTYRDSTPEDEDPGFVELATTSDKQSGSSGIGGASRSTRSSTQNTPSSAAPSTLTPAKKTSAGLPKTILASFSQPKKVNSSASRQSRIPFSSNLRAFAVPDSMSSQSIPDTISSEMQSDSDEEQDSSMTEVGQDEDEEEVADQDDEMVLENDEVESEGNTSSEQGDSADQEGLNDQHLEEIEDESTLLAQESQPKQHRITSDNQHSITSDNTSQVESQETLRASEDEEEEQLERNRNLAELNEDDNPISETQNLVEEGMILPKGDLDGRGTLHLPFNLESIMESLDSPMKEFPSLNRSKETVSSSFALQDAAIDQNDSATVESALSRFIEKSDFEEMKILGQFNLGFIIVRRTKHDGREDDLMIVDQHAADEKYNFEQLTNSTKLEPQRLFAPRTLQLSPSDELAAIENREALNGHGFQIELDENAPPGSRVRLIALPVSGKITFGIEDLEEVLNKLADEQPNSKRALSVRCTKLRSVLASRACRKSIMIGTALKQRQMEGVVRHLSSLDQPWNCPHGRPTMRHLYDLHKADSSNTHENEGTLKMSSIDWTKLG